MIEMDVVLGCADEGVDAESVGHLPGEHGGSGGRADAGGSVVVFEEDSLGSQLVEVRSFDGWVSCESGISVAEIIAKDDKKVGRLGIGIG